MKILQPQDWPKPRGYSNGLVATGELVFVSGQIGWNKTGALVSQDITKQIHQALVNVIAVLNEAQVGPQDIVRMTWYVLDIKEYRAAEKQIGETYRSVMGQHYPTMSLVQVAGLYEPGAKVEIEVTAVKRS